MRNRWSILAILFLVRLTMGIQFQSVAAVAPLLGTQFGVSLADIGLLIGLYFTPGVALALAGGGIGRRFGDKQTVLAGLSLMLAGELAMALSGIWAIQIAGRLVAGGGGVLLSVQMTKMVTDWFAGHEIATAMALFVNSWPAGIALSLLILPPISTAYGVVAAYLTVAAAISAGLLLLVLGYRAPATAASIGAKAEPLDRKTAISVMIAGAIWGLFNVGVAMMFSFGPSLLVERGWSISAAGSTISIALWLALFSVPAGGFLADRLKRPQTVLVTGCILFAALMAALARSDAVLPLVIALGLISGHPTGPILSLPARVLVPATRAIGMGLFFTLYYAMMMVGPVIGGAFAKWAGSAAAAFDFAALVLLICPLLLWTFNRIGSQRAKLA